MWRGSLKFLKSCRLRQCSTAARAPSSFLPGVLGGAVAGAGAAACVLTLKKDPLSEALERMPDKVILVRHGESEGNADHTLYRTKADNLIELTEKGSEQALRAGERIKKIIGDDKVHMFISPFQRTLQTARNARRAFEDQILHTSVTPQIREQEFGNLQGKDFKRFRQEQNAVGRLYYRFPTGESGCDVYDRTKSWWEHTVMRINERPKSERCDAVVVITHGLTMRLILMQLNGWSPHTFHTIWNADNCAIYILRKDLSKYGNSPYILSKEGDLINSSTTVMVKLKTGEKKALLLKDYLTIPQPRTMQHDFVAQMLRQQHGIDPSTVEHIDFFGGKFSKYM